MVSLLGGIRRSGFDSPALMALPVLVTTGGWLLGRRQAMWMIVVACLGVVFIGWMKWAGIPRIGAEIAPFGYVIVMLVVVVCGVWCVVACWGPCPAAVFGSSFTRRSRSATVFQSNWCK